MGWKLSSKEFWMSYRGLVAVLALCAFVFGAGYWWTLWKFGGDANERGDAAGLVNGLFSALAFAGVIYAIFLQRHELELQRGELEDQKMEFRIQNATLMRQRFENTFFNMLQMQHQITESLKYRYGVQVRNPNFEIGKLVPAYLTEEKEVKGREVFTFLYEHAGWQDGSERYKGLKRYMAKKGIEAYNKCGVPTSLGHYFRHLYHIFKFIAKSPLIDNEDRLEYASMVTAQLPRYELVFLYYNGLSEFGRRKFKPIIEELGLLENLRRDLLVKNFQCDIDYAPSAWGNREEA